VALSNAERQKRYRERLKALARGAQPAASDDLLDQLNRAYEEAEHEAIRETLDRIRSERPCDDGWAAKEAVYEANLALPPVLLDFSTDEWIQHARRWGAKTGQRIVLEARRGYLAEILTKERESREAEEAEQRQMRRQRRR
jgi:hypothetical protein